VKFHVWCPDRGEDESCACEVEANSAREAAVVSAQRDYWNTSDPFDVIELYVTPEMRAEHTGISHFAVQVEAVPSFTASFIERLPG
jgi:hypothetical protein